MNTLQRTLLATLLLALLGAPASAAPQAEGHYTLAGPAFGSGHLCADCLGLAGVNVGSVIFPANGLAPVHVEILDASGLPAPFTACQDVNGDGSCIIGEDPWASGCGSGDLVGFHPDVELQVAVKHQFVWNCEGELGTTGTVVVTYAE